MSDNPHGTFIWNELNTQDVAAAKTYLGAALGWTFEAAPHSDFDYWILKNGENRVGGMIDLKTLKGCDGIPEHWLSYIAVDDVDARYRKAIAAGAKEGRAPFDVPGVGRIAILQQPGGAVVALMTPSPM